MKVANLINFRKSVREGEHPSQRLLPWNLVEHPFRLANSDVLFILDCCNTGRVIIPRRSRLAIRPRKFEYITACAAENVAYSGDDSFTSALIWALQEAHAYEKPFSTVDLVDGIRKVPLPELHRDIKYDSSTPVQGAIVIEPLPLSDNYVNTTYRYATRSRLGKQPSNAPPTTQPSHLPASTATSVQDTGIAFFHSIWMLLLDIVAAFWVDYFFGPFGSAPTLLFTCLICFSKRKTIQPYACEFTDD